MSLTSRVRVALLSTGSEILQGLYPDTNSQWMAERLGALGFDVVAIRAVGDDELATRRAIAALSREADLIVSSGGLGPTEDDVLRVACARLWHRPLVVDARLLRQIERRFRRFRRPMPESNRRQALIPRGATPLPNAWGTAPGLILPGTKSLATLIALPGPPLELQPMFEKRALPWLRRHLWPRIAKGRTVIQTIGWPESRVNEAVADLFGADPGLEVTILARGGKIEVRLTASAGTPAAVRRLLARSRRDALRRLPPGIVYGFDGETLEEAVNRLAAARGWTLAVAESCTGGLVNTRLTDVPGASRILRRGVVTYADEAKERILGVRRSTLRRHGAVSEACAGEMAQGVRRWAKADLGLAISGIAGPTGGTPDKPIGLVWIAAATRQGVLTERHQIHRPERAAIRAWAADRLLNLARRILEGTAQVT